MASDNRRQYSGKPNNIAKFRPRKMCKFWNLFTANSMWKCFRVNKRSTKTSSHWVAKVSSPAKNQVFYVKQAMSIFFAKMTHKYGSHRQKRWHTRYSLCVRWMAWFSGTKDIAVHKRKHSSCSSLQKMLLFWWKMKLCLMRFFFDFGALACMHEMFWFVVCSMLCAMFVPLWGHRTMQMFHDDNACSVSVAK